MHDWQFKQLLSTCFFSSLWPRSLIMTLTIELDLNNAARWNSIKRLDQRSVNSKVIVRTLTHSLNRRDSCVTHGTTDIRKCGPNVEGMIHQQTIFNVHLRSHFTWSPQRSLLQHRIRPLTLVTYNSRSGTYLWMNLYYAHTNTITHSQPDCSKRTTVNRQPLCLPSASDWKPTCSLYLPPWHYTGPIDLTSPTVVPEVVFDITLTTLKIFDWSIDR